MDQQQAINFMQKMYNAIWSPLDDSQLANYYADSVTGHSANTTVYFADIKQHINNLKAKYHQLIPDFHRIMATGQQFSVWFTQHAIDYQGNEVKTLETMVTYEVQDNKIQQFWFLWDVDATEYFNPTTHPEKFSTSKKAEKISTQLTKRERDILYYLIRYFNTKEIARILDLSPRTIETHIENIKSKFAVYSKKEVIDLAIMSGYAKPVPDLIDLAIKQGVIKPL